MKHLKKIIAGLSIVAIMLAYPNIAIAALIYGNALNFNGTTQTSRSVLNAGSTVTDNFSMTCWVNVTAYPASSNGFVMDNGANDARGMGLYVSTAGVVRADYSFVAAVDSGYTLSTQTWYHIGVIRSVGVSQFYVNGTAQGATITNAPNAGGDYISVGSGVISTGAFNNYLNAKTDDCRFYERAITSSEILQLYNNGNKWTYTDISSANLLYWYKFDESSGTNVSDSSGNSKNLTTTNSPTWVTGIVAIGSVTSTTTTMLTMNGAGNITFTGNGNTIIN